MMAPVAFAGADQMNIEPYASIILSGAGNPDTGTNPVTYAWTQTAGTTTAIIPADQPQATAQAPATLAGETLTFQLIVTDEFAVPSAPSTVNITVLPATDLIMRGGVLTPVNLMRA